MRIRPGEEPRELGVSPSTRLEGRPRGCPPARTRSRPLITSRSPCAV